MEVAKDPLNQLIKLNWNVYVQGLRESKILLTPPTNQELTNLHFQYHVSSDPFY